MSRVTDIPHRVYTAKFKLEAVKLAEEPGVAEAPRHLDTSTIRNRGGDSVKVDWVMAIGVGP